MRSTHTTPVASAPFLLTSFLPPSHSPSTRLTRLPYTLQEMDIDNKCPTFRIVYSCAHSTLFKSICALDTPTTPHNCDPKRANVLVIYDAIQTPCEDCANREWDELDAERLDKMDDDLAYLATLCKERDFGRHPSIKDHLSQRLNLLDQKQQAEAVAGREAALRSAREARLWASRHARALLEMRTKSKDFGAGEALRLVVEEKPPWMVYSRGPKALKEAEMRRRGAVSMGMGMGKEESRGRTRRANRGPNNNTIRSTVPAGLLPIPRIRRHSDLSSPPPARLSRPGTGPGQAHADIGGKDAPMEGEEEEKTRSQNRMLLLELGWK